MDTNPMKEHRSPAPAFHGKPAPSGPPDDQILKRARTWTDDGRAAERRGAATQALECYDRALELLAGTEPVDVLADVLRWKGTVHRECGDTAVAFDLYRRSAQVAESIAYQVGKAHAANCLAIVAQRRGALAEAEALYNEAALLAIGAGEQRLLGMVQQNLGTLANIRGDLDAALVRYRLSLKMFEAADDSEALSWVLNNLGMLHTDEGNLAAAESTLARGLAIARHRGDARTEGALELNRVELLIAAGRWPEATSACQLAIHAADQGGDPLHRARVLKLASIIERHSRHYDRAVTALTEAGQLAMGGEDALLHAEVTSELAATCHVRGEAGAARAKWEEALRAFDGIGARAEVAELRSRLAAMVS